MVIRVIWLVIGIEIAPTSASQRTHLPSPAVVSPSPYALHLNTESIWRWGGVRQGDPAVVDPELELLSVAYRWAHLRADYRVGKVDLIVVACPQPGGSAFLAAGPVLSYYEFKHPMDDRLADEK